MIINDFYYKKNTQEFSQLTSGSNKSLVEVKRKHNPDNVKVYIGVVTLAICFSIPMFFGFFWIGKSAFFYPGELSQYLYVSGKYKIAPILTTLMPHGVALFLIGSVLYSIRFIKRRKYLKETGQFESVAKNWRYKP